MKRVVRGFGLIELIVTLLIVTVLVTLAEPSFVSMINKVRLFSASNDYLAAIYGTRSYAIRNGVTATLCPSNDGVACDDDASSNTGWLVLAGSNKKPVHYWPASNVKVSVDYPNGSNVNFGPDGLPYLDNGGFLAGHVSFCVGNQTGKVVLAASGRAHYERCSRCDC